ncbi:transglycosylase domain-containing protein [Virgibacillus sp. MG-45]|uniref:transglycosylase domain-containing protein n=1 Tax=Virgibacillus sp. MG-45 TaxID=3102791 RepID=UPI002ED7E591
MDFKKWSKQAYHKIISLWRTGKLQRSSRITYDVVWNVILFFLIIGFIGGFFGLGLGAGYFAALVKDEPIRSYESMEKDIYNYEETSKLYFANNVYIADISSDLHREETSLENVAPILIDAVIATEDEYFNEHKGVVPKAIVRAIIQEVLNMDMKSGGSTLTQQLIKNQILTNEVSFERKAKEILLALRLEQFFEKDQILEAYLNIVPYGRDASGRNIAGIQTAAQGIFGVNAKELNLPQAAFLAGMPQSPYQYTPFKNSGGLKDKKGLEYGINRMKIVLKRMYEEGFIASEKEYKDALAYDITADFTKQVKKSSDKYQYVIDELELRAEPIIKTYLAKQDGHTEEDLKKDKELNEKYDILARRSLKMDGYRVHSTIDKKIFDVFQDVAKNYKHYGPDRTIQEKNGETGKIETVKDPVQAGAMLIENNTGRIISFVGGRGYSTEKRLGQVNFATRTMRQTGSTIKPVLDYAPAMEMGVVQPGTPIADIDTKLIPVPGYPYGKPGNYGEGFHGIVSARTALEKSYNIPAARTYSKILHADPVGTYLEKMGVSTLTAEDHENISMSLGSGDISVEENTNMYTTFGNGGKFVDGYMIEKITTKDGKVIYEHKPEPLKVLSPQTNYLTIDMMRDVINSGTAASLRSYLKYGGVDWAGKTGTTNDYKDAWFVATNPNITMGAWIGYDSNESLKYCPGCTYSYSQRNIKLWAELINAATKVNPELLAPKERFSRPSGVVSRSYCGISGLLPSELCQEAGLVKTDLFNAKYVPKKRDDSLIRGSFVKVNGKSVVAGPNTPKEFVNGDGLTFNPAWLKREGYDKLSDLSVLFPRSDREKWEKIGLPKGDLGGKVKDDGKAPAAPSSLGKSGNKLAWKKSSSKDVVGYRVYRKTKPDGNYSLIGSTTDTSLSISSNPALYQVKAVDYFGLESNASKELMIGKFPDPDKEKPEKPKPDDPKKDEDKDNGNEKDPGNGEEGSPPTDPGSGDNN